MRKFSPFTPTHVWVENPQEMEDNADPEWVPVNENKKDWTQTKVWTNTVASIRPATPQLLEELKGPKDATHVVGIFFSSGLEYCFYKA